MFTSHGYKRENESKQLKSQDWIHICSFEKALSFSIQPTSAPIWKSFQLLNSTIIFFSTMIIVNVSLRFKDVNASSCDNPSKMNLACIYKRVLPRNTTHISPSYDKFSIKQKNLLHIFAVNGDYCSLIAASPLKPFSEGV